MDCRNCKWKGSACKSCRQEQEEMQQIKLQKITFKVVGDTYHQPINRFGR